MITKNLSLNLHFQVDTVDVYQIDSLEGITDPADLPRKYYRSTVPLVKYMKQKKEASTVNLMDSSFGDIPAPQSKEDNTTDNFYPHWIP